MRTKRDGYDCGCLTESGRNEFGYRMPHRLLTTLGAPINPWWDPNGEGLCVWSAYQPIGAASFAASLVDLSGNGNNAGDPGGAATPGWNALNGWICDGIGTYLTTTFIAANDQSQSALIQFANVTNNGNLFGSNQAANRIFAILPDNAGASVRYWNGAGGSVVPVLLGGNLGVAGNRGYRNGIAEGAALGAWAGANAQAAYIACRNNVGVPGLFCACNIQAFVIYDCILTVPQMLAVATAMAAP